MTCGECHLRRAHLDHVRRRRRPRVACVAQLQVHRGLGVGGGSCGHGFDHPPRTQQDQVAKSPNLGYNVNTGITVQHRRTP